MTPKATVVIAALALSPALAVAQQPKLPTPLRLPPNLEQTLPISKAGSYFGEAVKVQYCPDDKDNPLGLCDNLLFGGMAMFVSQLSGDLYFKFGPPINNVSRFTISYLAGLRGEPVVERAPILYSFPVTGVRFTDAETLTQGDLDLTTGEAHNLEFRLCVGSNILEAYKKLNPTLKGCEVSFPGVYGSSIGRFEQRADGLLDFTFFGSSFAPLGNNQGGLGDDRVRIPLPFCGPPEDCAGIETPGTSLRPRVRISTKDPGGPECGEECVELPVNTTQIFTASAYHTSMGDRFTELGIEELGGGGVGWSHLAGRIHVQFGDRYGDLVPVAIWAALPEGLLAEPPPAPIPGFGLNMVGVDGRVPFPNYTYVATDRVFVNDPFDFAVGVFDVRTGKSIGDVVYRGLPFQTLLTVILELNAGRIPQDTFRFQGPAAFERGPNGSLVFRYNGDVFLDFSTYLWPSTDYNPARAFRAPEGSTLNPFLKFQATAGGAQPVVVKSGQINEVSSFGDQITVKYSIPCDISNKSFSFEYTNASSESRGGTFALENLAAVSCTNARGSQAAAGDADIVSFSGYGTWSKDDERHIATVQISTAPRARYFIVQIDGGLVSNADTNITEEIDP